MDVQTVLPLYFVKIPWFLFYNERSRVNVHTDIFGGERKDLSFVCHLETKCYSPQDSGRKLGVGEEGLVSQQAPPCLLQHSSSPAFAEMPVSSDTLTGKTTGPGHFLSSNDAHN